MIVFASLMLILHFSMQSFGDDLVYGKYLMEKKISAFILESYVEWSSRVIIMPIAAFFASQNFILFSIVDTFFYFLLGYIISKLFVKNNRRKNNWAIILLLMCIPFASMLSTAGWIVTTIHYLWPAILGLVGLYPLKKIYNKEPIQKHEYVLCFLALIYGANMEIVAAILVSFYCIFAVYFMMKKENSGFVILASVVLIANMIFILTCPGNCARDLIEISLRFPEYAQFNFIQKMTLSATSFLFTIDQNYILFVVLGLAFALALNKYKKSFLSIIGLIPFLFAVLINLARVILLSSKFEKAYHMVTGHNKIGIEEFKKIIEGVPSGIHYVMLISMILFALSLIIMTFFLLKDSKKLWIGELIICAGIMSRVVIGLSPTVYASGARTFLFQYLALAIYGVLLYQKFNLNLEQKKQKILIGILCFFGIMGYLESFIKIFKSLV